MLYQNVYWKSIDIKETIIMDHNALKGLNET